MAVWGYNLNERYLKRIGVKNGFRHLRTFFPKYVKNRHFFQNPSKNVISSGFHTLPMHYPYFNHEVTTYQKWVKKHFSIQFLIAMRLKFTRSDGCLYIFCSGDSNLVSSIFYKTTFFLFIFVLKQKRTKKFK